MKPEIGGFLFGRKINGTLAIFNWSNLPTRSFGLFLLFFYQAICNSNTTTLGLAIIIQYINFFFETQPVGLGIFNGRPMVNPDLPFRAFLQK